LEGALVAAVSEAVPEAVDVRPVVREAEEPELVEARVCELNVVLRDVGTPVPIEAPLVFEAPLFIEVIVEFLDAGSRVDVPEKEMLEDPVLPMTANGPE
jgi:hypothetical protein